MFDFNLEFDEAKNAYLFGRRKRFFTCEEHDVNERSEASTTRMAQILSCVSGSMSVNRFGPANTTKLAKKIAAVVVTSYPWSCLKMKPIESQEQEPEVMRLPVGSMSKIAMGEFFGWIAKPYARLRGRNHFIIIISCSQCRLSSSSRNRRPPFHEA